ncbi:16S rRNA (guanine(527)-N(7))-methyltransferase RsmG [Caproiciproducens faecalis]|uniref:Ribosomal RNA small subunit methyltransferase G n=1 Tax=Caproiciproducens faecalis TaxID=2820301 RepID=A0ABS7DNM9_9FIRM|nr:16S rRNA (guanine(527)-N(7))-methyltransferase RsmG [Caproiciproducens faecalis]MBW7572905.1 16S rRNA (guanine(527)-N(7))-methyltransferase RsmG [Caproiciproducens faecalis]
MEDIRELLTSAAQNAGIALTGEQADSFQQYLEILLNWNQKINLTAIKEPDEVAYKHFLDSILILKYLELPQGTKLIDVGTGAGFPGVPLKIMRPDIKLTLLDGLNKRLTFLKDLAENLNFAAEFVHARAEEAGRQAAYRGKYDFASARAVAPLNLLCEYCLPFLKIGGVFIAMKGPDPEEEVLAAKNAISLLGCKLHRIEKFELPNGDSRSLVLVKRTKLLSAIYPRHGAKIAKSPL